MVELDQISKSFFEGRQRVPVLQDISLTIHAGECVLFRGPSGCGKSTLLNLIGTLARPGSGRIRIAGTDVTRLPEHFLCELRRKRIGMIFQQFNLLRGYTAAENVGMPLVSDGVLETERRRRSLALLESIGLAERADFLVQHLSGGEQQRVAIARALIQDPQLIIADEPVSNVDEANAVRIMELFRQLQARGKTIVLTTHTELTGLSPSSTFILEKGGLKCSSTTMSLPTA